jgi:hypothetical protein
MTFKNKNLSTIEIIVFIIIILIHLEIHFLSNKIYHCASNFNESRDIEIDRT